MKIICSYISKNVPKNLVDCVQETLNKLEKLNGLCDGVVSRQLMAGVNLEKRNGQDTLGRVYYSIQDFNADGYFLKSVLLYHYRVRETLEGTNLN